MGRTGHCGGARAPTRLCLVRPARLLLAIVAVTVLGACGGSGSEPEVLGASESRATTQDAGPDRDGETTGDAVRPAPADDPTMIDGAAPAGDATDAASSQEPAPALAPAVVPAAPAPPAAPPVAAAPAASAGRVDGTFEADPNSTTVVVLRGEDGHEAGRLQGTGTLPFDFDGVAPGTYLVDATATGPDVASDDGTLTSSSVVTRSEAFAVVAGETVTWTCTALGCSR